MGLTNVFGRNVWPIGQIFGQIPTSEISKFEEILGKNPKIRDFFFQVWVGISQNVRISKKNFQS